MPAQLYYRSVTRPPPRESGSRDYAKSVQEIFLDAEIMVCGDHAGRAHKKILELRQKIKRFPQRMISKYADDYPAVGYLVCKCKGNHNAN